MVHRHPQFDCRLHRRFTGCDRCCAKVLVEKRFGQDFEIRHFHPKRLGDLPRFRPKTVGGAVEARWSSSIRCPIFSEDIGDEWLDKILGAFEDEPNHLSNP